MLRHRLSVLATTIALSLSVLATAALSLVVMPSAPVAVDGSTSHIPETTLAWMSSGSAIFSVDTAARTVRNRGCGGDTGRISDPNMKVRDGVAIGRVEAGGTTYSYKVPLTGGTHGLVTARGPDHASQVLTGAAVTTPQGGPTPGHADLAPLTERLQQIVEASGNPAGVSVRDLSGRYGFQEVEVNGTFRPHAASVIKLWILAELLRQADCGQRSLDDGVLVQQKDVVGGAGELQNGTFPQTVSLRRLAQLMIIASDNTATNVLIDVVGGVAPVNALIDTLNQKQTVLGRKLYDTSPNARGKENYTSADEVVSLLGAVWHGHLLSPSSQALMIDFMREQTINTKIPAALPPGVPVAHKTGELSDVSHDVGYYLIPGSEVAVVFLTSAPEAVGTKTVRRLARAVYDYIVRDDGPPRPVAQRPGGVISR